MLLRLLRLRLRLCQLPCRGAELRHADCVYAVCCACCVLQAARWCFPCSCLAMAVPAAAAAMKSCREFWMISSGPAPGLCRCEGARGIMASMLAAYRACGGSEGPQLAAWLPARFLRGLGRALILQVLMYLGLRNICSTCFVCLVCRKAPLRSTSLPLSLQVSVILGSSCPGPRPPHWYCAPCAPLAHLFT